MWRIGSPAGGVVRRARTPAGDPAWLVTGYDTVKTLLADPRLGRTHADPDRASRYSESVIFGRAQPASPTEDADHARMRRLLTPLFSARRMSLLRPRVQEMVDGVLDELAAAGPPADVHETVSFPLPALVICELLGVPYRDREQFRRWSDEAADMTDQARSFAGLGALWQYMGRLVETKQTEPSDDVISALLAAHRDDPDGFGLEQVAQLAAALLFAGHETTVTAIDTAVVLLGTHPEQRDALRRDPTGIPDAVEEILRMSLSALRGERAPSRAPEGGADSGLPRWAKTDLIIEGITIPAGDLVLLDLHDANLDPRLVGDHPEFDTTRTPNPHLSFAHGPYFCIGAPLARLELQVLLGALLDRFPAMSLAVAPDMLRPRTHLLTGGLAELPLTW